MSILGVVLGVIGIIAGFVATLIGGWIGGAGAIALGVIAAVLGFFARKKSGKGMPAMVIGVIAIAIAAIMIPSTQSVMKELKNKLIEKANDAKFDIVSKYAEEADTTTGFVGFVSSMANKVTEEDKKLFEEQTKYLSDLLTETEKKDSTPTTQPSESPASEEQPAG